jgi:Magnesium chelatase, subunit ChlI
MAVSVAICARPSVRSEDGKLTISRAAASLTYPARCTLVAAMTPYVQATTLLSRGP